MAITQTFTVSHGREFGGSNPGAQWREDSGLRLNDGWFSTDVAFDSDRRVIAGGFYRMTIRSGTSWIQIVSLATTGGVGLALWNDGGSQAPPRTLCSTCTRRAPTGGGGQISATIGA